MEKNDTSLTVYIQEQRKNSSVQTMSEERQKTSLLELTSMSGVDIAGLAGVPYGTYRVWRTEMTYKQASQRQIVDFAHKMVIKPLMTYMMENASILDGPEGKYIGIALPFDLYVHLRDIVIYNDKVLRATYESSLKITFPDKESCGYPLLMKRAFQENVLSYLWAIRKGYVIWNDHGFVISPNAPDMLIERQDGFSVLHLAPIFAQPWTPTKEVLHQVMADFLKRVREIL